MSGVATAVATGSVLTGLTAAAAVGTVGATAYSLLSSKGGGGSGGGPQVVQTPNAPQVTDPSVQAAAQAQATAAANAAGRASTLLTSGLGDTSQVNVTRKQLLGG